MLCVVVCRLDRISLGMGKLPEALQSLEKAVKLEPGSASIRMKKAKVLKLSKEGLCALEVAQGKADAFVYDRHSVVKNQRRHDATLFMAFLAAFEAFLFRLTGERDLVIGTPVAGRVHQRVEGLIG